MARPAKQQYQNPKVAVIQSAPVFLNREASLAKALSLIDKAADAGANIIAFPESWLPGYPVWLDYAPNAALWDHAPAKTMYRQLAANAVSSGDATLGALHESARKHNAHIVMGAHERCGNTLYNSIIYIDPCSPDFICHRKLTPTYTERLIWGSGDGATLPVIDTPYGRLAGLICWEHWAPLLRATMHAKQQHIHVAQWSAVNDLHQIASRHYAFEGQTFVMAAGTLLSHDDVMQGYDSLSAPEPSVRELLNSMRTPDNGFYLRGGSAIIKPDGNYLVEPVFDEEDILVAALDLSLAEEGHLTMDTDGHYSRPDIFSLTVDERAKKNVVFDSDSS